MDLFSRYVFRQAAGAMILIVVTLTFIAWFITALKQLDLLTSQGQGMATFLKLTALAIPSLLGIVVPVALVVACLHTLNRLNADSEIIVMAASGASSWQMGKPFLILGLLVSLFIVGINVFFQPYSLRLMRNFIMEVRADLISQFLQPGKFFMAEPGLSLHFRARGANGDILGLLVHDTRDPNTQMSYLARRARIVKEQAQAYLVMEEGQVHRRDKTGSVQVISFDTYLFDLSSLTPKIGKIHYKPPESYIWELYRPDPQNPFFKKFPGRFRGEFHERLSNPLYPLLFVLIILAKLGHPRTTRENTVPIALTAFGIAVALRVSGLAAMNLAGSQPWAALLVYGVPIGGILVCLWVIFQHDRKLQSMANGLSLPVKRLFHGLWEHEFLRALSERLAARLPFLKRGAGRAS